MMLNFCVHDAIAISVQLDSKLAANKFLILQSNLLLQSHHVSLPPISIHFSKSNAMSVKRLTLEVVQRKRDKGDC